MDKLSASPELIDRFRDLLVAKMGLHVPKSSWSNWEGKLHPIVKAFGFANVSDCMSWLTTAQLGQEELNILARHLTIGETYFFRDANAFKVLEEVVFPDLIRRRADSRFLRIWCAACCTGEEPYSIAMLLQRMIPNLPDWNITILGTDINVDFLQSCEKAVYKEWSFRATPPEVRKRFFIKERPGYERLNTETRRMVKTMYLNLVEDTYPTLINGTNAMDLILCNNVLIYFSQDKIQKVVHQLTNALVDGGWLLTSAVEVPYVSDLRLEGIRINDATIFRKGGDMAALDLPPQVEAAPLFDVPPTEEPAPVWMMAAEAPPQPAPAPMPAPVASAPAPAYDVWYRDGRYREIVDTLEPALLNAKGKLPFARSALDNILLLARSYANLGLPEQSLRWVEHGLDVEKLDARFYLLQAVIFQEMGRIEQAIARIQKALFIDPGLAIGYYVLGNIMLKKGNTEEARRNFRNAERLLQKEDPEKELDGGDGLTAGRLAGVIASTQERIG